MSSRMHRISSELRTYGAQGPVSTRVGDGLGTPSVLSAFFVVDPAARASSLGVSARTHPCMLASAHVLFALARSCGSCYVTWNSHIHTLTHSHTHTLTRSHTHTLTHPHTHTLTHSNAHTLTHSHTHTLTRSHIAGLPHYVRHRTVDRQSKGSRPSFDSLSTVDHQSTVNLSANPPTDHPVPGKVPFR